MKILAIALAGLALACGKIDKTEVTSSPIPGSENNSPSPTNTGTALVIEDSTTLPACSASLEGQLIYVKSQAQFAYCTANTWRGIDVAGSTGLQASAICQMTVSQATLAAAGLDSAPVSGINFFYNVSVFGNGTKYVQARIASGETSVASGVFWDKSQDYYVTSESDSLILDVHGAKDFGFWYMSDNAELTGDVNNPYSIVYVDPAFTEAKLIAFDSATNCKFQSKN